MSDWKPYLHDRMISDEPEGYSVIVPMNVEPSVPLICGICNRLMRSHDDEISYNEFKCCNLCALQWAHPRRKEWNDGWRPSREMIDDVVRQRPPLFVSFSID